MILRNKKTGEIEDLECITIFECSSKTLGIGESIDEFYTIAELNEKWEDYKPKEPLIKDEEIRKILRAWADENETTVVEYKPFKNEFVDGYLNIIGFNRKFNELCDKCYTIDELCGEEQE